MSTRSSLTISVIILTLSLLASGCGEPESECGESGVVEHQTSHVGALVNPRSLCENIEWGRDGIGVYRVESLKTYFEDDPHHTYLELSLQDEWKPGAPANPTVRGFGGPGSDCRVATSSGSDQFTVGEEVVAFLRLPEPDVNKGYYILSAQGFFHDIGEGRFSNNILFGPDGIELAEFRALGEANGFDPDDPDFCSEDVYPYGEPRDE